MNQISRPMQIALAAVLVFAALWFVALKPSDEIAAEPDIPVATTPATDPGGATPGSDVGKVIEDAQTAAKDADAAVAKREGLTGEDDPNAPAATTPAGGTAGGTKTGSGVKADEDERSAAQRAAERTIRSIQADLKAGRAVVFLLWSKSGQEDRIVNRRVSSEINRRGGDVKVYKALVKDVGRYDGLIGSLNVMQTPSVVVIAPNNEAKVLGGLVSTVRIDRLTSSALLSEDAED